MALIKQFTVKNSNLFIKKYEDEPIGKFGHLNYLLHQLNKLMNVPNDIYIRCELGGIIEPGDLTTTFPSMVGWEIRVFRGGSPLNGTNLGNGSPYFTYLPSTGTATWSTPPAADEEFVIQAYKLA